MCSKPKGFFCFCSLKLVFVTNTKHKLLKPPGSDTTIIQQSPQHILKVVKHYGRQIFLGVRVDQTNFTFATKKIDLNHVDRQNFIANLFFFGYPASWVSWLCPHTINRANNFFNHWAKIYSMLWDSHRGSVMQDLVLVFPGFNDIPGVTFLFTPFGL